jgi:hypothetical protein
MSKSKLAAARELIVDNHIDAARAVLSTMPTNATAQKWLAKLGPAAGVKENGVAGWEYLEVYVKASERMPADVVSVMEDRPVTTVDHFFTRMLNDYGAEGWELVSEVLEGGDYVRLLFKRANIAS